MTPFPHRYTVRLANRKLVAPPREPIAIGPPPQFGGSDRDWSPEELLVGAALECLWTTFEALARRETLAVRDWVGTGTAILDRGSPVPAFTSITLAVELHVDAGDESRAKALLEKAEARCIVAHALNVPITLEPTVVSTTPRAVVAPPLEVGRAPS
jgi:organic hydroperoxide reductase OsmC/OhrA